MRAVFRATARVSQQSVGPPDLGRLGFWHCKVRLFCWALLESIDSALDERKQFCSLPQAIGRQFLNEVRRSNERDR